MQRTAQKVGKGFRFVLKQCRGFPEPLVFMHVPKTGGTSIDAALGRIYAGAREGNIGFDRITHAWKCIKAHEDREDTRWSHVINTALCFRIANRAPYLSGHFCVSSELIEMTRPPYRFVTLLREPSDRWVSNYIYSRIRQAQDGTRTPPEDIEAELHQYLESACARREGAKYIFALGGHQREDALFDAETIDRAKQSLTKFDAVGFLEDLPAFQTRLSELVKRRVTIRHLRKTQNFQEPGGRSDKDYKILFTPEVRERVKTLCQPDYALYQFARTLPAAC